MTDKKNIGQDKKFTFAIHNCIAMNNNLGINLTKEAKCIYSEIYKMLIKEIEEDKNKEKYISCL